MRVYSLFTDISEYLLLDYSMQKYGDVKTIQKYSSKLAALIRKQMTGDKNVLYVGVKYPYSDEYKKNFVLLTEKIAQTLCLPIVYAYYKYRYNKDTFYDNQKERKVNPPVVNKDDQEKYKDWKFIVIEDSVFTGNTIHAIDDSLTNVSDKIDIYCILDLRKKSTVIEKDLNESAFRKEGMKGLLRIATNKNFIPTTQFLRTYGDLLPIEKEQFPKNIRLKLERAFVNYLE